jgi:hypothetical protein
LGFTPLPDRETVTVGVASASVVSVRLPVTRPSAVGRNVTNRSLVAPAARSNGALEETVNAALPLMTMLVMRAGAVPVFVTRT